MLFFQSIKGHDTNDQVSSFSPRFTGPSYQRLAMWILCGVGTKNGLVPYRSMSSRGNALQGACISLELSH